MKTLQYIDKINGFCVCDDMGNCKGKSCPVKTLSKNTLPHKQKEFKNNIIIYGRRGCPYCEGAIKYFNGLGTNINDKVIFVEVVKNNPSAHFKQEDIAKELNHTTVPMICYNKEFIGGFDAAKQKPKEFWS